MASRISIPRSLIFRPAKLAMDPTASGCCWSSPRRRGRAGIVRPDCATAPQGIRRAHRRNVGRGDRGLPADRDDLQRRSGPSGLCAGVGGSAGSVDTACSSSLVALHMAVGSLRSGSAIWRGWRRRKSAFHGSLRNSASIVGWHPTAGAPANLTPGGLMGSGPRAVGCWCCSGWDARRLGHPVLAVVVEVGG